MKLYSFDGKFYGYRFWRFKYQLDHDTCSHYGTFKGQMTFMKRLFRKFYFITWTTHKTKPSKLTETGK